VPLKEAKGKLNMIKRLETLTVVGSLNVLRGEKIHWRREKSVSDGDDQSRERLGGRLGREK